MPYEYATMAGDDDQPRNDTDTAKSRLTQVNNHIIADSNISKRRRARAKGADADVPADYSDILGQIATLRKLAATPDPNNRGYVRQKQAGKLWVRERVEQLLDPGSFQEVGSVSGTVTWKKLGDVREEPVDFVPSNNVQGKWTCAVSFWVYVRLDTVERYIVAKVAKIIYVDETNIPSPD